MKYPVAAGGSLLGARPDIGVMRGPRQTGDRTLREGRPFATYNGAFHDKYNDDQFEKYLEQLFPYAKQCFFVAVQDERDWATTFFWAHAPDLGHWPFPLAYVAQTGCAPDHVSWGQIKALFLAGKDNWREGPAGTQLIRQAKKASGCTWGA
ncbi:hypothetical protein [Deinococcus hopiensis]|uniref:Uncharacterized protein n=1 Tax=Deinococcus hopiensis KR-140 TaxID=695939 RepID=A0A1W1VVY8_9DEIO|nr:hypothetical protein [Deinococcus hopiensis]SMB97410.1 hypothetical protein SAMN00790413_05931 [Deinococcus hopiensis KR-140]